MLSRTMASLRRNRRMYLLILVIALCCVTIYVIKNAAPRYSSVASPAVAGTTNRPLVLEPGDRMLEHSPRPVHQRGGITDGGVMKLGAQGIAGSKNMSSKVADSKTSVNGSRNMAFEVTDPKTSVDGIRNMAFEVADPKMSVDGSRNMTSEVAAPKTSVKGSRNMASEVAAPKTSLEGKPWPQPQPVVKEAQTTPFPWKQTRVRRVDCRKVFQGDPKEMERARSFEKSPTIATMTDKEVGSLAASCPAFKKTFTFINSSLTAEERDFPIAFSLLVFKDAEQVLRLLRAIYRPQNYYCVHVDTKSEETFHQAMAAVAACFTNVFLSSRSVNVQWGTFTVLEPELICMEDLWHYKTWKYLINLTGQEFPLKTNYELVKILTAFNGANSLEGTRKRANRDRWNKAPPPPGGIIPTKGSVHITANRDFVDFILHTRVGRDFLNWSRQVQVPDEVFFTSLNHNPHLGIRGTYQGEAETDPIVYPFLTRFKNWGSYPFEYPCASKKRVRSVCILSSGDLPFLAKRRELFANKFYAKESRVALDCLAERIFNRTREEYLGLLDFNVTYYASISFVKNMVTKSTFNTIL